MARLVALWLALSALLVGPLALAHGVGLSNGHYERTEHGLQAELVFAHADFIGAIPEIDRDLDGVVNSAELAASAPRLQRFAAEALAVTTASAPCRVARAVPQLTDSQGLSLRLTFTCEHAKADVSVELRFLEKLGKGHRHRAEVSGRAAQLYFGENTAFELAPGAARATPYLEYVRMGFWHILSGLDHVAFLLALVFSVTRTWALLAVVSSFTLAHSLSLALVTLGVWTPSSRYVEPAIALSIVYVALESTTGRAPKRPALVSFLFGLIHGMGFAGALGELHLAPSDIPVALVLFNGGVELGQLLLLCAVVPALRALTKFPWFTRRVLPLCSAALVASGVLWFVRRLG